MIIANGFENSAIKILKAKKNLRLIDGTNYTSEELLKFVSFNQNTNKYVFNNELIYDPTIRYGLYNGTYVLQNIPQSHPMAILNYNISGVLTYTGDLSKNFINFKNEIKNWWL